MQIEERGYFQRRLREEIARCARYHDAFSLVLLEATPAPGYAPNRRLTLQAARQLEHRLRACDVVAAVYDDPIAVMLVGTNLKGLHYAEFRIRSLLSTFGGAWRLHEFSYPEQVGRSAAWSFSRQPDDHLHVARSRDGGSAVLDLVGWPD